jgi:hypothetical protein
MPELHMDKDDDDGAHQHRISGSDKVIICPKKAKSDFVATSI